MKIVTVCGARPNVMKVAALAHAFREEPRIQSYVVHTGQHYDPRLSSDLFAELGLPPPEAQLHAAPDTPDRQLTANSRRFDGVIAELRPDWVVVVGDVRARSPVPSRRRRAAFPLHTSKRASGASMPGCPRSETDGSRIT